MSIWPFKSSSAQDPSDHDGGQDPTQPEPSDVPAPEPPQVPIPEPGDDEDPEDPAQVPPPVQE